MKYENYYILTSNNSNEWKELLNEFNNIDIFYDLDYIKLLEWEGSFGDHSELFVFEHKNKIIINPYFVRKLNSLPFLPDSNEDIDIISPYGYSGAIANFSNYSEEREIIKKYFYCFHQYSQEKSIISEFSRLNPFRKNYKIYDISNSDNIYKLQKIVYFNLRDSVQTLLNNMDQTHRRCMRKAIKNKLEFSITTNLDDIKAFEEIYNNTMVYLSAKRHYFYHDGFFDKAFEYLKDKIILAVIRLNDKIISGALFIWLKDIVHYWYGGSLLEFRNLYPNNLIFFEAAKFFKENGFKYLNLGGGTTPSENDNLFKFKYRLTKKIKWFYTYNKVYNLSKYNDLINLHEYYLTKSNYNISENESLYFPKYRENILQS